MRDLIKWQQKIFPWRKPKVEEEEEVKDDKKAKTKKKRAAD